MVTETVTPRIPPLEPPYEEAVERQLRQMMPPGVEPIALFRTFARNLPMAEAMTGWGRYTLGPRLSLTMREREILIDRTCARCGCEYEWGVHVAFFAQRVGLGSAEIASLTHGSATDDCWSERERLLIGAVDELHDRGCISAELWAPLSATFSEENLLDLIVVCGWYHAISFVARATGVPLESGVPRFGDYATG